jgi:hypothetical protein
MLRHCSPFFLSRALRQAQAIEVQITSGQAFGGEAFDFNTRKEFPSISVSTNPKLVSLGSTDKTLLLAQEFKRIVVLCVGS